MQNVLCEDHKEKINKNLCIQSFKQYFFPSHQCQLKSKKKTMDKLLFFENSPVFH